MERIAVVDYGMGNLRSVAKALEYVASRDHQILVTHHPHDIACAHRVVFPGQGAMGDCMQALTRLAIDTALRQAMDTKPFLGICIGLQALFEISEEGEGTPGMARYAGTVKRFPLPVNSSPGGERLKIPHMGWNQVQQTQTHPLWAKIASGTRFYFVHSYYVDPADHQGIAGRTDYGVSFASAIAVDNLFGVQFHPEKSQQVGLQLLANFLAWKPDG